MHATFKHYWYHTLDWLHRRGHIQRLAPSISVTQNQYHQESFWDTAIGPIPVAAVAFYFRNGFTRGCQVNSCNIVGSLILTWTVMVVRDDAYFAVHTANALLQDSVQTRHQWHHATYGDLTVFNTAYGDILDVTFSSAPFYAVVAAYVYSLPTWNPIDDLFLMCSVNGVDMMGHLRLQAPSLGQIRPWLHGSAPHGVGAAPQASLHPSLGS